MWQVADHAFDALFEMATHCYIKPRPALRIGLWVAQVRDRLRSLGQYAARRARPEPGQLRGDSSGYVWDRREMSKPEFALREAIAVNCDPGLGLNAPLQLHLPLVGHGPAASAPNERRLG